MKKIIVMLLTVLTVLALTACSSNEGSNSGNTYKVGILQLMTHGSLDEAREGMKDY